MAKFKVGDIIKVKYNEKDPTDFTNIVKNLSKLGYEGICVNKEMFGSVFSSFYNDVDNAYYVEKLGTVEENPEYLL